MATAKTPAVVDAHLKLTIPCDQIGTTLVVIEESSPSDQWRQIQRPMDKHWAELRDPAEERETGL